MAREEGNRRTFHPARTHPTKPCFIHVDVHAKFDKEVSRWVAGSAKLNVWSSGKDPKEALDRAGEAILLFLNEIERLGTVWEVLKEAGIRPQAAGTSPEPEPLLGRLRDAMKDEEYSFPLAFQIPTPDSGCHPD